jgi:hypothetical protein
MLDEHEASTPPRPSDEAMARKLAATWGLYCQVHRFARGAMLLADDGMGQEGVVLVRVMLEHTIVLHWIIARGDDGIDAMLEGFWPIRIGHWHRGRVLDQAGSKMFRPQQGGAGAKLVLTRWGDSTSSGGAGSTSWKQMRPLCLAASVKVRGSSGWVLACRRPRGRIGLL